MDMSFLPLITPALKTAISPLKQKETIMFLRLTFFKAIPEKVDELRAIYLKEIIPGVRKQKGNVDVRLLEPVNKVDDFISMTTWKTQADAEAYDSSGVYGEMVHKLDGLFTKTPELKSYNSESVQAPVL